MGGGWRKQEGWWGGKRVRKKGGSKGMKVNGRGKHERESGSKGGGGGEF